MKKIFLLTTFVLFLAGCGSDSSSTSDSSDNNKNGSFDKPENNDASEALKDPILEWCQLYNPNGFNTITCIVTNPNKVDIDITYDMVFYKDGKEVHRDEEWANFNIAPNRSDVIWDNFDIPDSTEVDEVKMENIFTGKSYYPSVKAEIEFSHADEDNTYFSVKHKEKPTLTTIWFLLYNDNNKNNKCDKGELVVTSLASTTEKEDTVYFENFENFTNYEIYYTSYKE
ncbi:MAG: membrane lipoprotein lipid attachment site-containing protein [Fibrobacter sp.]|nr:membrane lipoprotein lipid attachment site-containing protein [Fibrobacter sp.]